MSKYHIIDYSCTSGYDDKADCNTKREQALENIKGKLSYME